jgi:branched-chain amino acid transport system substrate-binding protein
VLPLTGDGATFGVAASNGARLAVDLFNRDAGGQAARWIAEDSRGEPAAAASAARKLIDVDGVNALVGDVTSAGTHALVPIATAARLPLLSPAASDPTLSGASPFFARTWPSDLFEAGEIANYARSRGYRRVAAVYSNDDYGTGFFNAFRSALGADAIALDLPFPANAGDFRAVVERIRRAGPDAVLLVSLPERARLFLSQLAEAGGSLPILATASIEDPQVAALPIAENIVFESPAPVSARSPARRAFEEAYRRAYNAAPPVLADTAFDCTRLLAEAHRADPRPDAMMAWIKRRRDYDGASGMLSFQPSGDVVKPYRLKRGRAGQFVFA